MFRNGFLLIILVLLCWQNAALCVERWLTDRDALILVSVVAVASSGAAVVSAKVMKTLFLHRSSSRLLNFFSRYVFAPYVGTIYLGIFIVAMLSGAIVVGGCCDMAMKLHR